MGCRTLCEREAPSPCGDSSEGYGPGMDFYSKRPPLVADERTQLTGWLDLQRALVRRKLGGLAEADEHRVVLVESPMMTPAGLVSHMRWTEHCWFNVVFLGESSADNPQFQKEPKDADMRVDGVPLAQLLGEFEAQFAQSNEIVAGHSLDDVGKDQVHADVAVDPAPHGRGDCAARRAPGHHARAARRQEGVLQFGAIGRSGQFGWFGPALALSSPSR